MFSCKTTPILIIDGKRQKWKIDALLLRQSLDRPDSVRKDKMQRLIFENCNLKHELAFLKFKIQQKDKIIQQFMNDNISKPTSPKVQLQTNSKNDVKYIFKEAIPGFIKFCDDIILKQHHTKILQTHCEKVLKITNSLNSRNKDL